MDLITKLRAAIDEIEQAANACAATDWRMPTEYSIVDRDTDGWQGAPDDSVIFSIGDDRRDEAIHAISHDPDTVLRMVAAHRKILDLHAPDGGMCITCCGLPDIEETWDSETEVETREWRRDDLTHPCPTLLAIAEGYGIEP